MKTNFLIIGGGVAGLSAANQLADHGADVTLLEAGEYPSHKICGEFLSPEAVPLLERWGINPASSVTSTKIILPRGECYMRLPAVAGTLPRYILDRALALRAEKQGACVRTGSRVERIEVPKVGGELFRVTLETGEEWTAAFLLLSTGRVLGSVTQQNPPKFAYVGAKAHFSGFALGQELRMFLSKGSYFGMAPIGGEQINVAGVIKCSHEQARDPGAVLSAFLKRSSSRALIDQLNEGRCLFENWMTGPIPEFGLRQYPPWPRTFFLGDAAGVIPPATGNGLAMGMSSGVLAAEYALTGDAEAYHCRWRKEYSRRIRNGLLLHRAFLSSSVAGMIPWVNRISPALANMVFRATRGEACNDTQMRSTDT